MSRIEEYKQMIAVVADALGEELLSRVMFIGGSTTGLLVTDDFSREQIRLTTDVDIVVHIGNYAELERLQQQLRERGFRDSSDPDAPHCAFEYRGLRVDVMPDKNVTGFGNRWYREAWQAAEPYPLTEGVTIQLVTPVYFLATKLEAYRSRGNSDLLGSRDMEDILTLVDGREELVAELSKANHGLIRYVATQFRDVMNHPDFDYALESAVREQPGRDEVLRERIGLIARIGG